MSATGRPQTAGEEEPASPIHAWTSPEHLPHRMLGPSGWTMPVCEIDLRPGRAWHFIWRRSDGTEMGMRGVYREITPPERLVSTESWGSDWPERDRPPPCGEALDQLEQQPAGV